MRSGTRISCLSLVQLLLVLLEGYCMELLSSSSRLPDIYWNASNPIFRIDNTDHIIDVNRGNNKFEYDQVNLICPSYAKKEGTETETESYIIYNVSKEEYDSCIITNSNARIIAVCDRPHSAARYFTITFRSFTPQPGGLEFKPGQDYYFISTSTGSPDGLYNRQGGSCARSHMKVTFKVCCGPEGAGPSTSQSGKGRNDTVSVSSSPVHHPRHRHHPVNVSLNAVAPTAASADPRFLPSAPTTLDSVRSIPTGQRLKGQSGPSLVRAVATDTPLKEGHWRPPPFHILAADFAPTSQSVTTSASTPFWWRPHYTKLPSTKHGRESDAISGASDPGSASDRSARKGRAWLLVVAAGIAVGVACLIVCGLGVGRRYFIREKHKPRMETVIHTYPRIHV